MPNTNNKINNQLRQQFIRRMLIVFAVVVVFVGFMSYALYKEYGPGAEIVDYFPQVNEDNNGDE